MWVDPHSPVALHEQVAAVLRRAIADGETDIGERLPPARDLAAVMGVNANTVFRALRTLRDEGLVEFRRGRGIHVAGGAAAAGAVIGAIAGGGKGAAVGAGAGIVAAQPSALGIGAHRARSLSGSCGAQGEARRAPH